MGLGELCSPVAVVVLAVAPNLWNTVAETEYDVAELCACMVYDSVCRMFACWDRRVA